MKITYCLCFVVVIFLGCASTVELNSIDDARMRIGDCSAIIHLKSGREYTGENVQVGNDSVRIVNMETIDTLQFPDRDIEFIKVSDHALGAIKGFFIGAVSLGVPTAILFYSSSNNGETSQQVQDRVNSFFTIIGTGIGAVVGLVIGGISGHHYTYILPEDSVKVGMDKSIDSTKSSSQHILKSAP
jgi:hypothetical protein